MRPRVLKSWLPLALLAGAVGCSSAAPQRNAAPSLAANEVDVIRDDWGVPHIYANTEEAGYFGLGFAQAEDQGERFMRMILFAVGRLAAVDGEVALSSDIEARRWMHEQESRRGYEKLDAHVQRNYRAFAQGFNQYFETHPAKAPAWRFPVEPHHLLAIPRGTLWYLFMAADGLADCQRGGAKLEQAQASPLERRSEFASNEWVLDRSKTADNAMILLSDPHAPLDGGIFYEYRMHAGELHSAGYSFGGAMVLANNRHLAWGMTTGAPDVSDCYVVETDPKDPLSYRFDGKWKRMTTEKVDIEVKGRGVETRTFAYTDHNGVTSAVIARKGAAAYVVSTPYMHHAGVLDEEFDRLNHAVTVNDAKNAMRSMAMFGQNLMFADSAGGSWYVRAGRTPKRPAGFDWTKPVPGNSAASAWQGIHAVDDLVQASNPPHGYMQNNNASPDQMTSPPPLVKPSDYAPYLFNDEAGRFTTRGVRAIEMLSRAEKVTVQDAIEFALDEKWPATDTWLAELKKAATGNKQLAAWPEPRKAMLREILAFDGQAHAESSRALKYYLWRQAMHEALGQEGAIKAVKAQWNGQLPTVVSARLMLDSVGKVVETMQTLFGTTDKTLGDVARFRRPPSNLYGDVRRWVTELVAMDHKQGSYPIGGVTIGTNYSNQCWPVPCEHTQRAYWSIPLAKAQDVMPVVAGSRALRLVVLSDPVQVFTMHAYGQSDDPQSPHYEDQARELTSKRKVKPAYFERSALQGHIESERRLVYPPAKGG